MAFIRQKITSYEVELLSHSVPVRLVSLELKETKKTNVVRAHISFREDTDGADEDVGSVTGEMLFIDLPMSYFSDCYHLLQTESPVFVSWEPGTGDRVDTVFVSTSDEPLGEGLMDRIASS